MVLLLKELIRSLDELLECQRFHHDACLNGLQVEGKQEIKRIATSVSPSMKVLVQAKKSQVDALIVHHGLFWKGANSCLTGSLKEKVAFLLKQGISLIAYHLPLDAHPRLGNNWGAALQMKWQSLSAFHQYQGIEIGVKGSCQPTSPQAMKKQLEHFYGRQAITVLGGKEMISSCALVSGGAHKAIHDALKAEVDCFITGTQDEYIWHLAQEEKIHFYALGHACTEKIGPQLLGNEIERRYGINHHFIDDDNPF